MLTSKKVRRATDRGARHRRTRHRDTLQRSARRLTGSEPTGSHEARNSTEARDDGIVKDRRIRIDKVDVEKAPATVTGPSAGSNATSRHQTLETPARSDGDADDQLQITLELNDPEPRGYKASDAPPRKRVDTTRWIWWAMGIGAVSCPLLLGFQLVFTDPAHGANVLAVVATMAFGALFATWTFEYWLRRGTAEKPTRPPVWTLTRHAILAFVGVAALAVSALNRTASFGLLILLVFTLVVADVVLRRVRVH